MNKNQDISFFIGKKGQGMSLAQSAFAMRDFYSKNEETVMSDKKKQKVDKTAAFSLGQAYGEDARLRLIAFIKKLFRRK